MEMLCGHKDTPNSRCTSLAHIPTKRHNSIRKKLNNAQHFLRRAISNGEGAGGQTMFDNSCQN